MNNFPGLLKDKWDKETIEIEPFENQFGEIPLGTFVEFRVENQSSWMGDRTGILGYDWETKEYIVLTENSGWLKIGGYLTVYINTIEPLKKFVVSKKEKQND